LQFEGRSCDFLPYITEELSRALPVVNISPIKSIEELNFWGRAKNYSALNMKSGYIDYDGEGPHMQNLLAVK